MIALGRFGPGDLGAEDLDAVWRLLCRVDREFVPALSGRESTITKKLVGGGESAQPEAYFAAVRQQHAILAHLDDRLAGLMSFRVREEESLLHAYSPATYISTVAVTPEARRMGIARAMYEHIARLPAEIASPFITTRTWSTNDTHIPLLVSLGYREVVRLPDHRGVGIDTVYYAHSLA